MCCIAVLRLRLWFEQVCVPVTGGLGLNIKLDIIRVEHQHITLGLQVTGYWLLVTEYWVLVTEYWLLVTGYWLLVTEFRVLVTGYWLLVIGY